MVDPITMWARRAKSDYQQLSAARSYNLDALLPGIIASVQGDQSCQQFQHFQTMK
ncbi:hypothetical protein NXC14_PC00810 (plasmid) [Rhizobium sp. NXC14]|nr:hypothetical protein NXC14_PC00810 [Rhizobium sp. NXC14]